MREGVRPARLGTWPAGRPRSRVGGTTRSVSDPRELLRHVWEFAADESCGACSPCRVGTRRGLRLAQEKGPAPGEAYGSLARLMGEASLCAFGRRVPLAVRSLARAYGNALEGWDR
ncbi:hypothetical protein HHL19_18435 [Streptomyces sp. R302]|nr:hypothetical protein [Streptomyces sp. R301]NML80599.1 hypothetical protein [Streptomyces sp. R302]